MFCIYILVIHYAYVLYIYSDTLCYILVIHYVCFVYIY